MYIRKRKSSGRKRKRKIGICGHRKKTGSRCEELQQNQKQYARKRVKKKCDESYRRVEFRARFACKVDAEQKRRKRNAHKRNEVQHDGIDEA